MNSADVEQIRHEAKAKLDPKLKSELGQYMTPYRIAAFMASLFRTESAPATLLDAGAGVGSLTIAASKTLRPSRVEAWEVDPVMRSYLHANLESLGVPFEIHAKDFIQDSVDRIQFDIGTRFTHAILNPPYKKIGSQSLHRRLLSDLGIETVNLYTAFIALTILQMQAQGQIVAIIPRSFCNGPYYKPFRKLMLQKCSVDHIHIFESRSKTFKDDAVLQENIILGLTRAKKQGSVTLSRSQDADFADLKQWSVGFEEIVKPDDREMFIHIPVDGGVFLQGQRLFLHNLDDLGLEVCTGPVVDFRLKNWWSTTPRPGTVPLLYPHHFTQDGLQYPKEHKKPNALVRSPEVDKWLMPSGFYVVVKRFSSKEERRRVVAYVVSPGDLKSPWIGFENHWNVLHFQKKGIDQKLANGLACFLNSTYLDNHFRNFSGHTQVNAADLRNMKYPGIEQLKLLGTAYHLHMGQRDIDENLERLA